MLLKQSVQGLNGRNRSPWEGFQRKSGVVSTALEIDKKVENISTTGNSSCGRWINSPKIASRSVLDNKSSQKFPPSSILPFTHVVGNKGRDFFRAKIYKHRSVPPSAAEGSQQFHFLKKSKNIFEKLYMLRNFPILMSVQLQCWSRKLPHCRDSFQN